MGKGERLRKTMALVEYLPCKQDVELSLSQGFSKTLIFERLKQEGRITMAYVTFCQTIQRSKLQEQKLTQAKEAAVAPPPVSLALPVSQPATPKQAPGPKKITVSQASFPDPRKMSLEDGI